MNIRNDQDRQLFALESMVEDYLVQKRLLRFAPELEDRYQKEMIQRRYHPYIALIIVSIIMYDLFMFNDKIMLPDIYRIAWMIRLGIVTPVMLALFLFLRIQGLKKYLYEVVTTLLFLAAGSIIVFLVLSRHPNVVHYYTGIILVITFGNIVVRLPFRYALGASLLIFFCYLSALPFIQAMPLDVMFNSSVVIFASIALSMVGNYFLENESRRDFLLNLKLNIQKVQLKKVNQQLENLSTSDPLTGLANRRLFDVTLNSEWNVARRVGYPLALIFIDIDKFKDYNDNFGHQAGDLCLKKIGQALRANVFRPHDLCARYGGEEFVVLLPHTSLDNAVQVAERIRGFVQDLGIPHATSGVCPVVTLSLGVACCIPQHQTSPQVLIELADQALYQAKFRGRNQVFANRQTCE